jgi:protein MpaA
VPSYDDLQRRWKALRASGTVVVREVACAGAARTLLCAQAGDAIATRVALSAGVHGDEPAGAYALLELAERGELDARFSYRMWPCMNPSGFDAGTRESAETVDINRSFGRGGASPEARAILTANRDWKFALSIDLHEDADANGFYCYDYASGGAGAAAIAAVREAGYAVEEQALLCPDPQAEREAIGGLSYTLSMIRHAAARALTFETPSRLDARARVEIHRIAVKAALAALANLEHHG